MGDEEPPSAPAMWEMAAVGATVEKKKRVNYRRLAKPKMVVSSASHAAPTDTRTDLRRTLMCSAGS